MTGQEALYRSSRWELGDASGGSRFAHTIGHEPAFGIQDRRLEPSRHVTLVREEDDIRVHHLILNALLFAQVPKHPVAQVNAVDKSRRALKDAFRILPHPQQVSL